jgi:hypothetical protein
MLAQEKRQIIIHGTAIYKAFTVLLGVVIAAGLITGMDLSNSASSLLAGSGLASFLGSRVNEKMSLGVFAITTGLCLLILFLRSWYCAAKNRQATAAL